MPWATKAWYDKHHITYFRFSTMIFFFLANVCVDQKYLHILLIKIVSAKATKSTSVWCLLYMGQIVVNGYWDNICWIIMFTGIVCSMQYLLFNQKNILRQSLFSRNNWFQKVCSLYMYPKVLKKLHPNLLFPGLELA